MDGQPFPTEWGPVFRALAPEKRSDWTAYDPAAPIQTTMPRTVEYRVHRFGHADLGAPSLAVADGFPIHRITDGANALMALCRLFAGWRTAAAPPVAAFPIAPLGQWIEELEMDARFYAIEYFWWMDQRE